MLTGANLPSVGALGSPDCGVTWVTGLDTRRWNADVTNQGQDSSSNLPIADSALFLCSGRIPICFHEEDGVYRIMHSPIRFSLALTGLRFAPVLALLWITTPMAVPATLLVFVLGAVTSMSTHLVVHAPTQYWP